MMALYEMPGHLIRRMNQISVATFLQEAQTAGFDLTPVQFAAIYAIARNEGIDQATLSSLIAYDRVTIGGVVDRLLTKGLIRREVSEKDRRARELYLTEKGRDLLEAMMPAVQKVQERMLEGLSAEERASLVALLKKATAGASAVPSDGQNEGD
jgi:MarR family transcriptional regulator, temperature-dependent positive regulator of motility